MGVISALVSGVSGLRAASGDSGALGRAMDDRFFRNGVFGMSAAGMRVTAESVKRLATVLACVQKKSTAIAMLPCKIYTDDGAGGRKVVTNHPLYDVLYNRPNHLQTAFEFKQMMQAHVELRGNGYAEIIPGPRGAVDQLMPMHPDRVRVEQLLGSGRLRYRYSDPLTNTERVLMQDEVFHLRENPDVIGVGQSRIAMACDVFGMALAQQDYVTRFMSNDATPGALITGVKFATEPDEDEFVESLRKARTRENRGRPFLLPPGADMKTLSVTPVDAQLLESIKASDVRICSIFNVLPHVVGVDAGKSATFASTEQFNLMHVQQCVLPMAIMWEEAIQRSLITSDRFYAKFSLASLMRGDAESRSLFYHEALTDGWMCQDDVRELEDMNPIADGQGKHYWNPLNQGRLDRPLTAPLPPMSGSSDEDEEDEADDPAADMSSGDDDDEQAFGARREIRAITRSVMLALVEHGRRRPTARRVA